MSVTPALEKTRGWGHTHPRTEPPRLRGSLPPRQSGEVDSAIYRDVDCQASCHPGEAPVTRASTPGREGRKQPSRVHSSFPRRALGLEEHLGPLRGAQSLLKTNSRSVRREISHWLRAPTLPVTCVLSSERRESSPRHSWRSLCFLVSFHTG